MLRVVIVRRQHHWRRGIIPLWWWKKKKRKELSGGTRAAVVVVVNERVIGVHLNKYNMLRELLFPLRISLNEGVIYMLLCVPVTTIHPSTTKSGNWIYMKSSEGVVYLLNYYSHYLYVLFSDFLSFCKETRCVWRREGKIKGLQVLPLNCISKLSRDSQFSSSVGFHYVSSLTFSLQNQESLNWSAKIKRIPLSLIISFFCFCSWYY